MIMTKRQRFITALIGLGLALLTSCERSRVFEPSPVGPSTISLSFDLTASPNVIYAGTRRATAEIRAVVQDGGSPLMKAIVYFTILSGPGLFYDYSTRVVAFSNENGVASVLILGPLKSEIVADQDIILEAQLESSSPNVIVKNVTVRVLRAPD
jgi:hypothetical protein